MVVRGGGEGDGEGGGEGGGEGDVVWAALSVGGCGPPSWGSSSNSWP